MRLSSRISDLESLLVSVRNSDLEKESVLNEMKLRWTQIVSSWKREQEDLLDKVKVKEDENQRIKQEMNEAKEVINHTIKQISQNGWTIITPEPEGFRRLK